MTWAPLDMLAYDRAAGERVEGRAERGLRDSREEGVREGTWRAEDARLNELSFVRAENERLRVRVEREGKREIEREGSI